MESFLKCRTFYEARAKLATCNRHTLALATRVPMILGIIRLLEVGAFGKKGNAASSIT